MALNYGPGKHRGRPGISNTDENYVIVESLLREDGRARMHDTSRKHCSTVRRPLVHLSSFLDHHSVAVSDI
jgi:hypothetical protein